MSRSLQFLIMVVMLVLLAGGYWTFRKNPTPSSQLSKADSDIKSQTNLPDNIVSIGSKEFSKGKFEKEESGDIYIITDSDGKTLKFPLTAEIVYSCTSQNLKSATTFDFDLVTKVTTSTPSRLNREISPGLDLVVMATQDKGVYFAHTLGIPEESCPK